VRVCVYVCIVVSVYAAASPLLKGNSHKALWITSAVMWKTSTVMWKTFGLMWITSIIMWITFSAKRV
jgi:hypothetical protein